MALIRSPVQEVAFSIQRRTSTPVNALDVADLQSRLADRYPLFQQTDALDPISVAPNSSAEPIIQFGAPDQRYWMLSEDSKLLVQFQHDRLSLNWRRLAPSSIPAEYPGYEALKARFLGELGEIDAWLTSKSRDTEVSVIELYYMNAVEIGERRISDILTFYTPAAKRRVSGLMFNIANPIVEDAPEQGLITTNCTIGVDVNGVPNVMVHFTARTVIQPGGNLADDFDRLHTTVLEILREVFTSSVLEEPDVR